MNASTQKKVDTVRAVTAALAGPMKVHVLLLDRYEAGDSDIEGIFGTRTSADKAAYALIEEWFDEDRIDADERKKLRAEWRAHSRAELTNDRKLECYAWEVTP